MARKHTETELLHFKAGANPSYLAKKYPIPSESTVTNWIIRYTDGKKTYSPNSGVYNIMGAKKSYEEKVLQMIA